MRQSYYIPDTRCVADLDFDGERWLITRINTPVGRREQGFATFLLDQICRDADHEGVDLHLQVLPGGGAKGRTYDQLVAWYRRAGFELTSAAEGWMTRPNRRLHAPDREERGEVRTVRESAH